MLNNEAFFEPRIERITESGCWIWVKAIGTYGYGHVWHHGGPKKAHRVAYEKFIGKIPDDMHVLHHCDVRSCVNPDHLFLGTNADNVSDRNSKGRQARGITHSRVKLTESQVLEIRKSNLSPKRLSEKYPVTAPTIYNIKARRIWSHL